MAHISIVPQSSLDTISTTFKIRNSLHLLLRNFGEKVDLFKKRSNIQKRSGDFEGTFFNKSRRYGPDRIGNVSW